jgi:flagellar FliJ protein
MKKFRFPLENVLHYKNQVLDALQAEHAALMAQVREQEEIVRRLEAEYCAYNEEYREKKLSGMTIMDAIKYESGLQSMENEIQREMRKLEEKKGESRKEARGGGGGQIGGHLHREIEGEEADRLPENGSQGRGAAH